MRQLIEELAAEAGLSLAEGLSARLDCHWQLLQQAHRQFNLTAITEPQAAAQKHYLDCLLAAELARPYAGGAAADLGSGGGFPGLVWAALQPQQPWTLIESAQKKAAFLRDCAAAMELPRLAVAAQRAEEAGRDPDCRGRFQLVTARAVAELAVLAEYALPLLAEGGVLAALKGPDPAEELAAAGQALALLGGTLEQVASYRLPRSGEGRTLIIVRKTASTPEKYPRRPGMPAKRPL